MDNFYANSNSLSYYTYSVFMPVLNLSLPRLYKKWRRKATAMFFSLLIAFKLHPSSHVIGSFRKRIYNLTN